jgi:hypothetical protein
MTDQDEKRVRRQADPSHNHVSSAILGLVTPGALTVFRSDRGLLAKTYTLADGKLDKQTAAQLTHGTFRRVEFADVAGLAAVIEGLTTHEAISASLAADGSASGRVVTQATLSANPGALARTKQHFQLQGSPGVGFIDHDCAAGETALTRDALWQMLLAVVPALAGAGVLWRPSGSSNICNGERDLTGLRGQHLFVLIEDASDWPRVVRVIARRLWLAGHGRIVLSASGSMLERCPIDTAPADAARLIFAAGAACAPPLEQRRGAAVVLANGGFLDSRAAVPDLSDEDEARAVALVESAKSAKFGEAQGLRELHKASTIARRLPGLLAQGGGAADAQSRLGASVDAAFGGVLLSDFELSVVQADGRREAVTVGQVLSQRERFHEANVLDPINPEHRGGSADGRLFLMGSSPILYSLDDGGTVYRLRQQLQRIGTARGARGELVEAIGRFLAEQDDVLMSDGGPVQMVDGRSMPLNTPRLMNLAGARVALFARGPNGKDCPTDLNREAADLVLASLN